ncbi:AAA domain-containing protein [Desulfobacula toluolica]|uniref:DNA2/NAM7 helicase helicase domain-containing protein n=1 Tax=Desulfobacula toluolica (strain DSM 7467 / Tol2) TaxID=651182 RepID=K0NFE3_DESTT|nr:AAA domain-containing protein [Desulfobacula toluolica]CCK79841.1 uncharacterized protein TOL2_C16800 [Desulfobacula toluolica Tol2]
MQTDEDRTAAWQEFADLISILWEKSIVNGKGPHMFCFGSQSRQDLLDWAQSEEGKKAKFLWQTQPNPWTDLRQVFKSHFHMPAPGIVSLSTLGHVFGCTQEFDSPPSLFHNHGTDGSSVAGLESMVKADLSIMVDLYAKACFYLKSQWVKEWEFCFEKDKDAGVIPYLEFIKEEQRLQEDDILTLQELTLQERMLKFRAIGHLRFDHTRLNHEGRFLYVFKFSQETCPSKFRTGDFLRLAPHGIQDIQTGFPVILAEVDMGAGQISILSRSGFARSGFAGSGQIQLTKNFLYSLEEDTSDWNQDKLTHVAATVFKKNHPHYLQQMLAGQALDRQPLALSSWLKKWIASNDHGLNSSQQRALALPFQYRTSLIQGPPGTGKTHLLGWILIVLILQAHEAKKPLRIGVSALTHQAIDTVLKKVTKLVSQYLPGCFPGCCIKCGQSGQLVNTDAHKNPDENSYENSYENRDEKKTIAWRWSFQMMQMMSWVDPG